MTDETSVPLEAGFIPTPLVYTIPEVAILLKVSERMVGTLLRSGQLVRRKIGSRTLVPRSSIEAFLRRDHPGRTALVHPAGEEGKRPHRGSAKGTRRGSR